MANGGPGDEVSVACQCRGDQDLTGEAGERIESYPDDTPLPSYLLLGTGEGRALHLVATDNETQDETIVITSYEPDPNEWESDFKTGKRRSCDA